MSIHLHKNDLPDGLTFSGSIAVDTETLGLKPRATACALCNCRRGRRCPYRAICGDNYDAPNLKALLSDRAVVKIFHYARFDLAAIAQYLGVHAAPLWCTKIASKLVRTYTDRHGLKDLCRELLDVDLSKPSKAPTGGHRTVGCPAQLCRLRCFAFARAQRPARNHARPRRPRRWPKRVLTSCWCARPWISPALKIWIFFPTDCTSGVRQGRPQNGFEP